MHDRLTPAEVGVLTVTADTSERRWWTMGELLEETDLPPRALAYAIHELERKQLIQKLRTDPRARRECWSITTTGERALSAAQEANRR